MDGDGILKGGMKGWTIWRRRLLLLLLLQQEEEEEELQRQR